MFLVLSYNSTHLGTKANVVINGLYATKNEATQRQIVISGDHMKPVFEGSKCMIGTNNIVSWIREIPLGDTDHFDVKQPG